MIRMALVALTLFVAAGATFGGLGLIMNADLGMDRSLLNGTPFDSYVIPGYILLIVVGGSNLLAGVLLLVRHPHSGYAGTVAGTILTVWTVVQVAMIGYASVLQPIFFAVGILTVAYAFRYWLELVPVNHNG